MSSFTITVFFFFESDLTLHQPLRVSRTSFSSFSRALTVQLLTSIPGFLNIIINRCVLNIEVVFLNITYFFGTSPETLQGTLTDIPSLQHPRMSSIHSSITSQYITHTITLSNLSSINLVSILGVHCFSPQSNPVYVRRVDHLITPTVI
jgi:hypothetical protein